MTDAMAARATVLLQGRAVLRSVTASFGHPVIATRVSYAVAAHAALAAFDAAGEGDDAVILGCFGDPGLEALREVSPVPVTGLAEASFRRAISWGEPFAVLTIGPAWQAMLQERVTLQPGAGLCREIRALDGTGLDFAGQSAANLAVLERHVRELADSGARTIILGGAVLAGAAARLGARIRLLDCLEAAVEEALGPTAPPTAPRIPPPAP